MISYPTPVRRRFLKGSALVGILTATMLLGIMGASVVKLTSSSQSTHLSANATSRAYYLAESGLSYAQNAISTGEWRHGRERSLNFLGGGEVSVIRKANYFWATSVVDAGTATEGRATVPMRITSSDSDFDGPDGRAADDFAIFGEFGTAIGQGSLIDGAVSIIDDAVDVRGDIEGGVYAGDVLVNGQGTVEIEITGGIYSSGTVTVRSGTVKGDINADIGVSIFSAQATVEGWVFSNGDISIDGGATVLGHVHSYGADVSIAGSSTIGTPDNPVEIRASGDVYLSENATIYGTIYAGGDIFFSGSAKIYGDAYAGGGIDNSNVSGEALGDSKTYVEEPIAPDLSSLDGLELPPPTEFSAGGSKVTLPRLLGDALPIFPLSEGSYRNLQAPNNSSGNYAGLLLSAGVVGHANYYFDSVNIAKDNKVYLNLAGSNDLRIFVEGNVNLNKFEVFVSTDGVNYLSMDDPGIDPAAASRVYWEVHGDYDLSSEGRFFGSVYTPYGSLTVGNTSLLYGSYYSGGGHNIIGSKLVHVAPNYYAERKAEEEAGN